MAKKRLYLKIFGDVQGVNFRYYSREKANELDLVGWIKNASDGTVECEVLGEEEALKKFLEWARKGPSWAAVRKVEEQWGEYNGQFKSFEIRF
jgi:acylphosphatase